MNVHTLDEARWQPHHAWLIGLTALTIIFDGMDNQLLGVVLPTIMREWAAPRAAFAPVVSSGSVGMMIGGAIGGLAGDRFGRRTALLASVAIFGAMTMVAALSADIASLAWLRLAAGLGLGGAMPNAAALAAEYVPRAHRPLAVTATIVCVPLGATLAGLLGIRALPVLGWRALFVVGGAIPVVAAALLRTALPESPHYLARHRGPSQTESPRAPIRAIFDEEFRRDTFWLWGAFFSCLLAVYLGFGWLTTLMTDAGLGVSTASAGITAFNLGGVAGALAGGMAISRMGSRRAMLSMTVGAIAGALALVATPISARAAVLPILVLLTITGGLINAVQTTMYALGTHVYPSAIRATGVGTAVAVGRLGAIASGYAGAWALAYGGSASFFVLMATTMSVCLVSLALVRRHVPGREARVTSRAAQR